MYTLQYFINTEVACIFIAGAPQQRQNLYIAYNYLEFITLIYLIR